MERNVEIVTGSDKKKIVRIYDIRFQGKRSIDWRQVREYLKDYVGVAYEIAETKDIIYIVDSAFCGWKKSIFMISWT